MRSRLATALAAAMICSGVTSAAPLSSDAPREVVHAIQGAEKLNENCRGGSGDNPQTQAYCDQRDSAYTEIHKLGWCYGDGSGEQVEADKSWQRCEDNIPPRYDAKTYCRSLASMSGSPSEVLYGACIKQEQSSYDGLKATWLSVPPGIRRYCDELARMSEPGSYILLSACIRQELSAQRKNSETEFNY